MTPPKPDNKRKIIEIDDDNDSDVIIEDENGDEMMPKKKHKNEETKEDLAKKAKDIIDDKSLELCEKYKKLLMVMIESALYHKLSSNNNVIKSFVSQYNNTDKNKDGSFKTDDKQRNSYVRLYAKSLFKNETLEQKNSRAYDWWGPGSKQPKPELYMLSLMLNNFYYDIYKDENNNNDKQQEDFQYESTAVVESKLKLLLNLP